MARPTQEEIFGFNMPPIELGAPVIWYASATKERIGAEIAFIMHVGTRTVTLYTARGKRMDAVRHVKDPKLKLSIEQREQGAWDYTPMHLKIMSMERRLSAVERKLVNSVSPENKVVKKKRRGNPKAGEYFEEFRLLKEEAKSLGIETYHKKKDVLKRLIHQEKLAKGLATPGDVANPAPYAPVLSESGSIVTPDDIEIYDE